MNFTETYYTCLMYFFILELLLHANIKSKFSLLIQEKIILIDNEKWAIKMEIFMHRNYNTLN